MRRDSRLKAKIMRTADALVLMSCSAITQGCNVRVSTYFWPGLQIFNVHRSLCPCRRSCFNVAVVLSSRWLTLRKRDIVSIHWTQGALSSDWLGQPPLTCPWPIRGECAVCVFVFVCTFNERLWVCVQMMCVSLEVKLNTSFVCVRVVAFLFSSLWFLCECDCLFSCRRIWMEWHVGFPQCEQGIPPVCRAETLTSGCERVTAC